VQPALAARIEAFELAALEVTEVAPDRRRLNELGPIRAVFVEERVEPGDFVRIPIGDGEGAPAPAEEQKAQNAPPAHDLAPSPQGEKCRNDKPFADIDKGEAWLHQMDVGVYAFSHQRNSSAESHQGKDCLRAATSKNHQRGALPRSGSISVGCRR
jgi:hypothetical protein